MQRLTLPKEIVLFLFLLFVGCNNPTDKEKLFSISGATMGTTYHIKVMFPNSLTDKIRLNRLQNEIDSVLKVVNQEMSTYIETSELSQFNKFKSNEWFPISKDFAYVIKEALKISKLTNGAYDITVGPLVNLWGFGPEENKIQIPTDSEIERRREEVGYQYLQLKENPPAIKKENPDLYCDLSSIAKGFGVDKVSELLLAKNIINFMVEIGGEVRTSGYKAKRQKWRIGISSPDGSSKIKKVVLLENLSMATSGDYNNNYIINGKEYSHTIDPRTGRPITHSLVSVSVIDSSCMVADGFATAIDVLGPINGFEFALKNKIPVLMFIKEKNKFVEKSTREFDKLLKILE